MPYTKRRSKSINGLLAFFALLFLIVIIFGIFYQHKQTPPKQGAKNTLPPASGPPRIEQVHKPPGPILVYVIPNTHYSLAAPLKQKLVASGLKCAARKVDDSMKLFKNNADGQK